MKTAPLTLDTYIGYCHYINQAIDRKMTDKEYKMAMQAYISSVKYEDFIKTIGEEK